MKRELLKEINNPDEPPTTEIAVLEFNSTDDAVKAINANDLSDYYSPYREAYEKECLSDSETKALFSVLMNDNVAFAETANQTILNIHSKIWVSSTYHVSWQ